MSVNMTHFGSQFKEWTGVQFIGLVCVSQSSPWISRNLMASEDTGM